MDVWFVRCSHIVRGRSLYVTLHFFPSNIGWYWIIWNWYWMSKEGHPFSKAFETSKTTTIFIAISDSNLFTFLYWNVPSTCWFRDVEGNISTSLITATIPGSHSPAVSVTQVLRHCRDSTGTGGYQLRLSCWSDVFGPSMTFISRGECPSKVDAWVAYSQEWRSTHLLRWAMGLTIPG